MTPPTKRQLRYSTLMLLALFAARATSVAAPAAPSADDVITKARAALGPEDKLTGVVTLRLTGNLVAITKETTTTTPIVLLFKKPSNQRIEAHNADGTSIVQATNGMEGWAVATDKDGSQKLGLIGPPQLEEFVYQGLENMYFYRAADRVIGARTSIEGPLQFHDAKCWKLSTAYPRSVTMIRYIDTTSGELRGTETSVDHNISIEAGRITEGGIHFPAEVKTFDKDNKLIQTLNFSKIEINQPMDDKIFAVPSLASLHTPPPSANGNITGSVRSGSTATALPLDPGIIAPLPPLNSAAPASTAPASSSPTLELPPLKK